MLRAWPKSKRANDAHREIFLERYDQILAWAFRLSGNRRHVAEDLLQDAFVFLANSRPDLSSVRNLDGYLYVLLRNLHRAQLQKALRQATLPISILEFDSADAGIRSLQAGERDDATRLETQNDLRRICYFACQRKETSRGGSILIMRFFHGYFPHEIASILRCTRAAVDERLHLVRNEARIWLGNPHKVEVIPDRRAIGRFPSELILHHVVSNQILLDGLREMISSSRSGECPALARLRELYRRGSATKPDQATLAHLVSCEDCLNTVNRYLGLSELSERDPNDTLGNGSGTGNWKSQSARSGRPRHRQIAAWERLAVGIQDHRPKQLCIAVNGQALVREVVNSVKSELTITVTTHDQVDFVEVLSEQDVRLAMLVVTDPPPSGPLVQTTEVPLSGNRLLQVALSFDSPWPTLHVTYVDPGPQANTELEWEDERSAASPIKETLAPEDSRVDRSRVFPWFLTSQFWFNAKTLSSATAIVMIAVLLLIPSRETLASAAALIARADEWKRSRAKPGLMLHRTFDLFEKPKHSTTVLRRRVEVWLSADSRFKVSRLFDESGKLLNSVRASGAPSALTRQTVWQFEPAADTFRGLAGDPGQLRVERGNGEVDLISVPAILRLNDHTFAPIGEVIQTGDAEFEFREIATDSVPESSALRESSGEMNPRVPLSSAVRPAPSNERHPGAPTEQDLDEAEVSVRLALHDVKADLGEDVHVRRWGNEIEIAGFVDSRQRKAQIAAALRDLAHIRVSLVSPEDLSTTVNRETAGALATAPEQGRAMHPPLLENWLEANYPGEPERRAFEQRAMSLARDCARRALAVQEIAERYGRPGDRRLAGIVADHLGAMRRDLTALNRELVTALPQDPEDPSSPPLSWTDAATEAFVAARTLESEVLALFTATTMEGADVKSTRRNCKRSQLNLEAALSRLFRTD